MKAIGIGDKRAWLTVVVGAMFYGYQFIIRVSPNVMSDDIMKAFTIDAVAFGLIVSVYYWSYSALQIPLGIMMDRLGPKKLIAGACALCGIACFMFASTTDVYIASFARLLMGTGSACGFLGSLKLGSIWVHPKKFGSAIAITYGFGTVGAAVGGTPLRMLNDTLGWQFSLNLLGVIGFILAILVLVIIRSSPYSIKAQEKERIADAKKGQTLFFGLKLVGKRYQSWLIAGYGMLMYVPLTLMGDAWGAPFMITSHNIDDKYAATFITTMFIGAAFGAPFFTLLSDYLERRIEPMLIGALGALMAYLLIIYVHDLPLTVIYILFFLGGFCYSAKALSFATACEVVPRSQSGVAIGFNNMVVMTTGIVFHPMVGYLLNWNWDKSIVNGAPHYAIADYKLALTVIPVSLILAIIILKFIRETHPGKLH